MFDLTTRFQSLLKLNDNKPNNSSDFKNDNNENESNEFPSSGIVEKMRQIHLGAAAAASNNSFIQQNLEKNNNENNLITNPIIYNPLFTNKKKNILKQFEKYTWIPSGECTIVERYLNTLPIIERPIINTQGAKTRRQRLAYQVNINNFIFVF